MRSNKISVLILFIIVLSTMGMGKVPPPITCKNEPVFSKEIEDKIVAQCQLDCTNRKIATTECNPDCITFTKWGLKYGNDK